MNDDHDCSVQRALSRLSDFCSKQRLNMALEKLAQADLETNLLQGGFKFKREQELSKRDKPDFLVSIDGHTIVLELKTRAQRKAIYRQLERYAQHASVDGLLLMTGTAMGLPPHINNKPSRVVSMGGGWL
ncbi:hypothetical protein [Pseudomonas sp. GXZC]|uniref:hypothetical protein n=1 Tax=Pseudomonas sp. GXZC TaxID=3003351 RepID=UPI0022AA4D5F|nr:hypothetical protein [Pseudomonas sp. GXZC]WAT32214.1 hypothetical protein OZ428_33590 [Pseudomonas sp. GXZC]